MSLLGLLEELVELREKANLRANAIIDNGREIPEIDRAKAQGAVDAYDYCIIRLRNLRKE